MKDNLRRFIAMFLAVAMVFVGVPMPTFATDAETLDEKVGHLFVQHYNVSNIPAYNETPDGVAKGSEAHRKLWTDIAYRENLSSANIIKAAEHSSMNWTEDSSSTVFMNYNGSTIKTAYQAYGYIQIPESASVRALSDDGVYFEIGSQSAIDWQMQTDGLAAIDSVDPGTYDFFMSYMNWGGQGKVEFQWNVGGSWVEIPASAFSIKTQMPKIESFAFGLGEQVTITQPDNGNNGLITVVLPDGDYDLNRTPSIGARGESLLPSGNQDFTSTITYTVSNSFGTTRSYDVVVSVDNSVTLTAPNDSIDARDSGYDVFTGISADKNAANISYRLLSGSILKNDLLDVSVPGTYEIEYTATYKDVSDVKTRTITVNDFSKNTGLEFGTGSTKSWTSLTVEQYKRMVLLAQMQTAATGNAANLRNDILFTNHGESQLANNTYRINVNSFRTFVETSNNSSASQEDFAYMISEAGYIYNKNGEIIGEAGTDVFDFNDNLKPATNGDEKWTTVQLNKTYTNPVVIAELASYTGGNTTHVRLDVLRNPDGSSSAFNVYLEEWKKYENTKHHNLELVSYMVFEEGKHLLANDITLLANLETPEANSDVLGPIFGGFSDYSYGIEFKQVPKVFSQVQTYNDDEQVWMRQKDVQVEIVKLNAQRERAFNQYDAIGVIAIGQELIKHEITFATGTNQQIASIKVVHGQSLTLPVLTEEPVGKEFDYWKDQYGNKIENNHSVVKPLDLSVVWKDKVYNVKYLTGGAGETINKSYVHGSPLELPTLVMEGYEVSYWYEKLDNDQELQHLTGEAVVSDLTLIAKWVERNHVIKYYDEDGTYFDQEDKTLGYNASLEFAQVTKAGHEIAGWTHNGQSVDGNTLVKSDMDVKVVWRILNYNITYETGVGPNVIKSTTYDQPYDLTALNDSSKVGYTFLGWLYKDTLQPVLSTDKVAGPRTLVANWQELNHTVKYFDADGSYYDGLDQEVGHNDNLVFAPVTKAGYYVAGWTSGGQTVTTNTLVTGPMNVTVVWEANDHTIIYITDTDQTIADKPVKFDALVPQPELEDNKIGYVQDGWLYNGNKLASDAKVVGNMTLTANWIATNHDVNYYDFEGNFIKTVEVAHGDTLDLLDIDDTNYIITWTNKDTSASVSDATLVKAALNVIYAREARDFTITYVTNSNDSVADKTVEFDTAVPQPELEDNKIGYVQDGWLYNGNKLASDAKVVGNMTLTANWIATNHDVNYYDFEDNFIKTVEVAHGDTLDLLDIDDTNYIITWTNKDTSASVSDATVVKAALNVIYAREARNYTIQYETLTDESVADKTSKFDQPFDLPQLDEMEKVGYVFAGWLHEGTSNLVLSTDKVTGNETLTASWIQTNHTVKFFDQEGNELTDLESSVGHNQGLVLTTPEKTGHTFAGWYNENNEKVESGDLVKSDLNIKQKWTTDEFLVTYATGTDENIEDQTYEYQADLVLPTLTVSPVGKTFIGWFEDARQYNNGDDVVANLSLEAEWKPSLLLTPAANFTNTKNITINTSITDPAKYFYTLNGSTPRVLDNGEVSSTIISSTSPSVNFTISNTTTVKAIVVDSKGQVSDVVSVTYTRVVEDNDDGGNTGGSTPPPAPGPGPSTPSTPSTSTPVTSISLNEDEVELEYGTESDPAFFEFDLEETIRNSDSEEVTWSVADEEVATVDENGVVKAVKAGQTTVTVTHVESGATATAKVEVFLVGEEQSPLGAIQFFDPYITGYPDKSFGPLRPVTRAEIATMFTKILRLNTSVDTAPKFGDVNESDWYYTYVQAIQRTGLFVGDTEGNFRPNDPISRGEMATVFVKYWRFLNIDVEDTKVSISDVKDTHWASEYIYTMYNAGIVASFEDGTYRPNDPTLREQVVGMINTLIARPEFIAPASKFVDIETDHWAYGDIEAASQVYVIQNPVEDEIEE